jgi:hypothetical protein
MCVRFESRHARLLADLERECRRMPIVVTCRCCAREPSSERGHLPFGPFVRVFTTATGVAPEWGGTDGVDLAKGQ